MTDVERLLLYILACFLFEALMEVLIGESEARPWAIVWAVAMLAVLVRAALRRRQLTARDHARRIKEKTRC